MLDWLGRFFSKDKKGADMAGVPVPPKKITPLPLEKRKYKRFSVCWHFRLETAKGPMELDSINLAFNGMAFLFQGGSPPEMGSEARVLFKIPPGYGDASGAVVIVRARLCRTDEMDGSNGVLLGYAILRFDSGRDAYAKALETFDGSL